MISHPPGRSTIMPPWRHDSKRRNDKPRSSERGFVGCASASVVVRERIVPVDELRIGKRLKPILGDAHMGIGDDGQVELLRTREVDQHFVNLRLRPDHELRESVGTVEKSAERGRGIGVPEIARVCERGKGVRGVRTGFLHGDESSHSRTIPNPFKGARGDMNSLEKISKSSHHATHDSPL